MQDLGTLVNTLASHEKKLVLHGDNLRMKIQMQLSQKQKDFSQFFAAFLKSILNFEYFEKKMTLTDFVFPRLQTPKTRLD